MNHILIEAVACHDNVTTPGQEHGTTTTTTPLHMKQETEANEYVIMF